MKSILLTTVVLSVPAIFAAQIVGQPCAKTNLAECGHIPDHNNDLPFAFLCGPKNTILDYIDCGCATCCKSDGDDAICTLLRLLGSAFWEAPSGSDLRMGLEWRGRTEMRRKCTRCFKGWRVGVVGIVGIISGEEVRAVRTCDCLVFRRDLKTFIGHVHPRHSTVVIPIGTGSKRRRRNVK
ncbi:hypothetical protein K503DRAFT_785242 [Rhizopogon vinicolor AM-OR11-026]|uniref:Uncharacterized protein n=1 Tax=Rhizopogon vinicolor AM-OR11-026 TaxID=1314800 RepID=A0A1B7MRG2_9AGAM|nr:hypothetical protein K503DRAFT_785242 [Rhizopogon vinicolor AM-OR11-026]